MRNKKAPKKSFNRTYHSFEEYINSLGTSFQKDTSSEYSEDQTNPETIIIDDILDTPYLPGENDLILKKIILEVLLDEGLNPQFDQHLEEELFELLIDEAFELAVAEEVKISPTLEDMMIHVVAIIDQFNHEDQALAHEEAS